MAKFGSVIITLTLLVVLALMIVRLAIIVILGPTNLLLGLLTLPILMPLTFAYYDVRKEERNREHRKSGRTLGEVTRHSQ